MRMSNKPKCSELASWMNCDQKISVAAADDVPSTLGSSYITAQTLDSMLFSSALVTLLPRR